MYLLSHLYDYSLRFNCLYSTNHKNRLRTFWSTCILMSLSEWYEIAQYCPQILLWVQANDMFKTCFYTNCMIFFQHFHMHTYNRIQRCIHLNMIINENAPAFVYWILKRIRTSAYWLLGSSIQLKTCVN